MTFRFAKHQDHADLTINRVWACVHIKTGGDVQRYRNLKRLYDEFPRGKDELPLRKVLKDAHSPRTRTVVRKVYQSTRTY